MPNSREFLPHGATRPQRTPEQIAAAGGPAGLDYPATQVGVTGQITVSYDPSLGAQGLALAQQLLNVVSAPYQQMQSVFATAGGACTVVVSPLSGKNDGSGGAYHHGCDFSSGRRSLRRRNLREHHPEPSRSGSRALHRGAV